MAATGINVIVKKNHEIFLGNVERVSKWYLQRINYHAKPHHRGFITIRSNRVIQVININQVTCVLLVAVSVFINFSKIVFKIVGLLDITIDESSVIS